MRPAPSRQMSGFCGCWRVAARRRCLRRLRMLEDIDMQRHAELAAMEGFRALSAEPCGSTRAHPERPSRVSLCVWTREKSRWQSENRCFLLERGLPPCYSSRAHLMFLPNSVRQTAQSLGRLSTDAPENTANPLSGGTQSGRADEQRRFHQGIITQACRSRGPVGVGSVFWPDP